MNENIGEELQWAINNLPAIDSDSPTFGRIFSVLCDAAEALEGVKI